MRRCEICGECKDKSEFSGKIKGWCRGCWNAKRREDYHRNKPETTKSTRPLASRTTEDGKIICVRCNIAKSITSFTRSNTSWCLDCSRELQTEKRRASGVPERVLSYIKENKKFCLKCEQLLDFDKFDKQTDGVGGLRVYCKECIKQNYYSKERSKEQTRKYRLENRHHYLMNHRITQYNRRRNIKAASDGTVTKEFSEKLYSQEFCEYCGVFVEYKDRTADHVIPLCAGGLHSANNLVMACFTCNSSKRDSDARNFIESRRRMGLFNFNKVKVVGVTQPVVDFIPDSGGIISYAARVSSPSNQDNFDTAARLLKYCLKHKHYSVFETVNILIEIETTRDIARQILRHRSFSFQEFSQRYAEAQSFVVRDARLQDNKNRQNSIETDDQELAEQWNEKQQEVIDLVKKNYAWALENGIAKECARVVLPEGNTMSRMYMNGTVRSWLHYCDVRDDLGVTQLEHVDVARKCKGEILKHFPFLEEVWNKGG